MKAAALATAALYSVFIGGTFLLGQLFVGRIGVGASLAGFCGIATGVAAFVMSANGRSERVRGVARNASLLGFLGVALDASEYYWRWAIPGNYYAWFLIGPFCAALLVIAVLARRTAHDPPPQG